MHAELIKTTNDPKEKDVLSVFMEAAMRYAGGRDALAEVYMMSVASDPTSYWHIIHDRARWDAIYKTGASPSTYAHAAFKLVRD